MNSAKVGTYWDKLSQDYQFENTKDVDFLTDMILQNDNTSIFEASVGSGIIPKILREKGFEGKYLGSDYCQVFIDAAKANNPKEEFIAVDLLDYIDAPDKSFDACVVRHGLEYVFPYRNALAEMKRVAKKYIYIMFWVDFVEENRIRFNEDGNWNVNYYKRSEWEQILNELRFSNVEKFIIRNDNGKDNYLYKLTI